MTVSQNAAEAIGAKHAKKKRKTDRLRLPVQGFWDVGVVGAKRAGEFEDECFVFDQLHTALLTALGACPCRMGSCAGKKD